MFNIPFQITAMQDSRLNIFKLYLFFLRGNCRLVINCNYTNLFCCFFQYQEFRKAVTAGGLELTEPARVVPPQTFYTGKKSCHEESTAGRRERRVVHYLNLNYKFVC